MSRGRRISIPRHRRLVLDVCYVSQMVPSFPVEKWMQLGEVEAARRNARTPISWVSIYLKAFGLIAKNITPLRQLFVQCPWNHLYEHPFSVGSVSIHRDVVGSDSRLIWARCVKPEEQTLESLQAFLQHAKTGPLEEVFRDGIRIEKLPACLRRWAWRFGMRWHGRQRAKKVGTFTISTLAGMDVMNRNHPLVTTCSLAYTKVEPDGRSLVTLICDHRVLDGVLAANALHRLDEELNTSILNELKEISRSG